MTVSSGVGDDGLFEGPELVGVTRQNIAVEDAPVLDPPRDLVVAFRPSPGAARTDGLTG